MNEHLPAALRNHWAWVAALAAALLGVAVCPVRAQEEGVWEAWRSETFSLDPRESFQFRVGFTDIPVRSWRLVVDSGDHNGDLSVVRTRGQAILYHELDQVRHVVDVPWGTGEEIVVVVTNRDHPAGFVVTFLGPPRDQVQAAYSYHVNRALEAFAAGRRLDAEELCREALADDPRDAVAMVMLAGFLKQRGFYDQAATLVESALAGELTPEMRTLAQDMRLELEELRAPLPVALREGIDEAERHLEGNRPGEALAVTERLLATTPNPGAAAKSRLHLLRGRALAGLGRNFEALDAYTAALQLNRSKADEAIIYHHMGRLYLEMGNHRQAQGAYTMALQIGLPSGLDVQAREDLLEIERILDRQR